MHSHGHGGTNALNALLLMLLWQLPQIEPADWHAVPTLAWLLVCLLVGCFCVWLVV